MKSLRPLVCLMLLCTPLHGVFAQESRPFANTTLAQFWAKLQKHAAYRQVERWGRETHGHPLGQNDEEHFLVVTEINRISNAEHWRLKELYDNSPRLTPRILEMWLADQEKKLKSYLGTLDANEKPLALSNVERDSQFARDFENTIFILAKSTQDRGFSTRLMYTPDDRETARLVVNGIWGSILTLGGGFGLFYGLKKNSDWSTYVGLGLTLGWAFFSRWTIVWPNQNFPRLLDFAPAMISHRSAVATFLARLQPERSRTEALRNIFSRYIKIRAEEIQSAASAGSFNGITRSALSRLLEACHQKK